jgi:excisionase family DNA binding protein
MKTPDTPSKSCRTELSPIAVSIDEAARLVGISRASLYKAIKHGFGPATATICGRRVVRVEELYRWVRSREQQQAVQGA